jgi:hypothetical protein
MHTDPLMHVVPPRRHRDLASLAAYLDEEQFCAWDMLCGKREPELGGDPAYMDVVGVNYYQTNQWSSAPDKRSTGGSMIRAASRLPQCSNVFFSVTGDHSSSPKRAT